MNIFDEQWKDIIEGSAFSETATITTVKGESFDISGMYYSGSYENVSSASYSAKRWEREDFFQISTLSLPDCIKKPKKDLRNAQVELKDRGVFTIFEVKGEESGMLTIAIQPKEYMNV